MIGPYRIDDALASGGLAEVYRVTHTGAGTRHALKVLREDTRPFWHVVHKEVRAAAGLDHPNLVRVHDYGLVQRASPFGALGAPWVAMELCEGGSLNDRARGLTWNGLRGVLLQLLDGLAHAHARGVLHRDVKGGNVVFDGSRAVLTDFGLAYEQARHLADEVDSPSRGGTPSYVAPEQLLGQWHLQGPWTDLYALAAMAWTLSTGRTPYGGTPSEKFQAHLRGELPAFRPRWPVPEGFEGWLRRGMARQPLHRPAFAVQARRELARLGKPVLERPQRAHTRVGLGVAELLQPRLVGRASERARLLARLEEVRAGATHTVVLEGPSGVGKVALGRWLLEEAHRYGRAQVLRASYDPGPGRRSGLEQALATLVRALGEDHDTIQQRALERLGSGLDPLDARGIADLLAPRRQGAAGLDTPAARFALVRRVLGQLGPTVLLLEQAHWGRQATRFARTCRDLPLLLVLTVDPELADEGVRADLRELQAETLRLDELSPAHSAELGQRLGLSADLSARLTGRPLLMVQTLRWWVQRGELDFGPEGLEARGPLQVPEDLDALWRLRLDGVLEGQPGWREPLGALAVLGVEVDEATWTRACEALGGPAPRALLAALTGAGLAHREQGRVVLDHPTLRRSMVQVCSDPPRLHAAAARSVTDPAVAGRHHLAAGELLEALGPLFEAAESARRRGDYREAEDLVGLHDRALRVLPEHDPRWGLAWIRRATLCQVRKDLAGMELWAHQALQAARDHGWQEVQASARLKLSAAHRLRGRLSEAWQEAQRAGQIAERLQDPRIARRVTYEKMQVTARMGLLQESLVLSQAYLRATRTGPPEGASIARAWLLVASAHARLGMEAEGAASLQQAREAALASGERFILASCALIRGETARKQGEPGRALEHYREAEHSLELLGHGDVGICRLNIACCELDLGGRLEARLRELLSGPGGVLLRMGSLAALLACVADRDDGEAEQLLDELEQSPLTDADFARYAELAAQRCLDPERRRRLQAYASEQRRRMR